MGTSSPYFKSFQGFWRVSLGLFLVLLPSCNSRQSGAPLHKPLLGLVNTAVLGKTRQFHYLRTLTHFHSPFSYDACDDLGLTDQKINLDCLNDVREAICTDHEDVIFATDHPNNMARFPFEFLMMHQNQDEWILSPDGKRVGNKIHCADGFTADWYPGIEARLIALGVQAHSSENIDERISLYNGEDLRTKMELELKTRALITIPHTESRSLDYLEKLKPAAIEIYNFHAYMDPRIRSKYLGLNPLRKAWVFLRYLLDPFRSLDSDYMFAEFVEFSPVYFEKWDALQAKGIYATGVGGADSHQTIFKWKMSDGERLDHHRRMIRFFSNFILTEKNDEAHVKDAIANGRNYFVVEQWGSPTGMDFYARTSTSGSIGLKPKIVAEMGDIIQARPKRAVSLVFQAPTLYPSPEFALDTGKPEIWAELIRVDETGKESSVKTTSPGELMVYNDPTPGHYRVQVWIKPRHLIHHLYSPELAEKVFIWVISNHIHVL